MKKTRVLLTGGTGFIGRNILEQLGQKYVFFAPSHHELELIDTEQVNDYLRENPVDIVIHAANRGGTRKILDTNGVAASNLKIFFNLIQANRYFQRLIMIGSGAEYDKSRPITKVSETDFGKLIPSDEYGLYKYVAAQYAENVSYITHLRLFGVFGKYEDYEVRFISNAICKALLHLPITIRQNVNFDYLFIDDFIKILDACINRKPVGACMNVGRGEVVDLKSIAELIICETGESVPILIGKQGLGNEYSCDVSRLRREFSSTSYTPLKVAIKGLIAYYRGILPSVDVRRLTEER